MVVLWVSGMVLWWYWIVVLLCGTEEMCSGAMDILCVVIVLVLWLHSVRLYSSVVVVFVL